MAFIISNTLACAAAYAQDGAQPASAALTSTFQLAVNPAFLNCLAANPDKPPVANVKVVQGKLNDTLTITVRGLKPKLAFDLFTVQKSSLDSAGNPDPQFTNFGLAWYQSDLQANAAGKASVKIKTILINQIFGFDPAVALTPTNTFHVGFWFNDPNDAAACGFDPSKPTPFNGEHMAGPLAMISLPNATTGLGPLCLSPGAAPGTCNP